MRLRGYDAATYGDRSADVFDQDHGAELAADDPMVTTLLDLAGRGPALELGVGTGRVALPLARRGVAVEGVDASAAMLERLQAKDGDGLVAAHLGDFTALDHDLGRFRLVYAVANTALSPPTLEGQAELFAAAARHLDPDGTVVVEAEVPDPDRFTAGQRVLVRTVEIDRVTLLVSRYDRDSQLVVSQNVTLTPDGVALRPEQFRWTSPSELDLLAEEAGLERRHRWAGWQQEQFDAASTQHVSVYRHRS